jgi:hypothetical protein
MTDRSEHSLLENPETVKRHSVDVSRRALLRRAAPAVITLYSGAALAKSSNLITADSTPSAEGNKYRCLDTYRLPMQGNKYDLGKPALGHVTRIQSQKQYYKPSSQGGRSSQTATGPQMCSTGGDYYRKDWNSYTKVNVKKGVLVSSTALNSFSSGIQYTDV